MIEENEKAIRVQMRELIDKCNLRVKQNENLTADKFSEAIMYMRNVDDKFNSKAN